MAKIEELTLHLIEKEKQLSSANERIEEQSAILSSVLTRLAEIESNDKRTKKGRDYKCRHFPDFLIFF